MLKTDFYNYMHFVIFLSSGILELEIYKMLKVSTYQGILYQGIQKKLETLDTLENSLRRAKLLK